MAEPVAIGLDGWIIEDGNYADFHIGEIRPFALEYFAQKPLLPVPGGTPVMHRSAGGPMHTVIAHRMDTGLGWTILDFGILAYRERDTAGPVGLVFGEIYLGVDPFPYFERLAKASGAPALIYDWRIERIEMQTAPFIAGPDGMQIRDPEKLNWRAIPATRGGSFSEYVLYCTPLSLARRNRLTH